MYTGVIGYNSFPAYFSLAFLKELKKRGHKVYYFSIENFACEIREGKVVVTYQGKSLNKINFFLLRTIGNSVNIEKLEYRKTILKTLEEENKLIINPPDAYLKARNKLICLSILASKNIKVPTTLVTENEFLAYEFVKKFKKCVVKPLIGSRGIGSFLIDDPDIAYRRFLELKEKGFTLYIQQYINKPGRDMRIFVVGDEVLGGIVRESNYWKTNVYQGAEVKPIKINKNIEKLAIKVTKVLGLLYSGIDIAEENNEYYVLEVNAAPLWLGFQQATGINPAEKIINLAERLVKK